MISSTLSWFSSLLDWGRQCVFRGEDEECIWLLRECPHPGYWGKQHRQGLKKTSFSPSAPSTDPALYVGSWVGRFAAVFLVGGLILSHQSWSLCPPSPSMDSLFSSEGKPTCQEVIWTVRGKRGLLISCTRLTCPSLPSGNVGRGVGRPGAPGKGFGSRGLHGLYPSV